MTIEPGRAPVVRRVVASVIDGGVALVLTGLLATTVGLFWAERAVVTFRIGESGGIWTGLGPMLLGLTAPVSYGFAAGLLLVLLAEALFGVSPGKMATRLSIRRPDGRDADPARLVRRFQVKTAGILLYLLALATGLWHFLVPAVLAGLVVLLGACGLFGPAGRTLHDRIARTAVVRL